MSKQSREAFLEQVRTGKRETNMVKVYNCLAGPGGSAALNLDDFRKHFSGLFHMPHQTLTSALSALMDMGLVGQHPQNGYFYAVPSHMWNDARKEREEEKFRKWLKKGLDMGWHQRARDIIKPERPAQFWDNYNQL